MKSARHRICTSLFVVKASLAIVLGALALGFNGYKVYDRYATAPRPHPLPPIGFPAIDSADASRCYYNSTTLARLEPPDGTFLMGISPSFTNGALPQDMVNALGFTPPLYNSFISISATDFQADIIEWNCQLVGQLGGVLELSAMPTIKASQIPDEFYTNFALFMRKMNSKYGVPILLRFMHEMNGNWMTYGLQPTGQKQAWIKLSNAIRAQTNLTALVWSPNIGGGYPFTDNLPVSANSPDPEIAADFLLLDTNHDGVLNNLDSPYSPYYPGDQYIDWIGISVYDYERNAQGATTTLSQDAFINPTSRYTLFSPSFPFYDTYVMTAGKPFLFSETGAAVDTNIPGQQQLVTTPPTLANELQIKQAWWRLVLNSSVSAAPGTGLSKMKAAVWFEIEKTETSGQNVNVIVNRDYTITTKPAIAQAFAADLKALGSKITYPNKFKFTCDGSFTNIA